MPGPKCAEWWGLYECSLAGGHPGQHYDNRLGQWGLPEPTQADAIVHQSKIDTLNRLEEFVDDSESPYAAIYGVTVSLLPTDVVQAVEAYIARRDARKAAQS